MVHRKAKNRQDFRCDDTLLEQHTHTLYVGLGKQEGYFRKLLNRYSRLNLAARDWLAL